MFYFFHTFTNRQEFLDGHDYIAGLNNRVMNGDYVKGSIFSDVRVAKFFSRTRMLLSIEFMIAAGLSLMISMFELFPPELFGWKIGTLVFLFFICWRNVNSIRLMNKRPLVYLSISLALSPDKVRLDELNRK